MNETPKRIYSHPEWADQVHTEKTEGFCNCPDCVQKRGFFLAWKPYFGPEGERLFILHKREPKLENT
jgi:hypothetical protein